MSPSQRLIESVYRAVRSEMHAGMCPFYQLLACLSASVNCDLILKMIDNFPPESRSYQDQKAS